jgi:hypothetical protein
MVRLRLYRWPSQSESDPAWGILYDSKAAHDGLYAAITESIGVSIEIPVSFTIDDIFPPGAVKERWRIRAEHRGAVIIHDVTSISMTPAPSSPPTPFRPSTPESPTYRDIPVAAMLQEQR